MQSDIESDEPARGARGRRGRHHFLWRPPLADLHPDPTLDHAELLHSHPHLGDAGRFQHDRGDLLGQRLEVSSRLIASAPRSLDPLAEISLVDFCDCPGRLDNKNAIKPARRK